MKNNTYFRRKFDERMQTKLRFQLKTLLIILFAMSNFWVFGQVNQLETDKGIAASIAPYNADVRQAILQVSQYLNWDAFSKPKLSFIFNPQCQ